MVSRNTTATYFTIVQKRKQNKIQLRLQFHVLFTRKYWTLVLHNLQQRQQTQDRQHLRSGQRNETPYLSFPGARSCALQTHSSAPGPFGWGVFLHKLQNPFSHNHKIPLKLFTKSPFHNDWQTDDSSFRTAHQHGSLRDVMSYALHLCACARACVRTRGTVGEFPRQSRCVSTSASCLQTASVKEREGNTRMSLCDNQLIKNDTHTHTHKHL